MNQIMKDWYNRFCEGKSAVKVLPSTPDACDLAEAAAKLAYRASVLRALKMNGKNNEAKFARQEGEKVIKNFLCEIYSSETVATIDFVAQTWETIYQIYKKQEIQDYTYGNAQKWVNMAIKYYVILLQKFNVPCSKIMEIPVFPVDRIMINYIKKDLGVSFDGNWSDCKDLFALKKYICDVNSKVNEKGLCLFEYELNAWNS